MSSRTDGSEPAAPWLDAHEHEAWRAFLRMEAQVQGALRRQLQRDTNLSLQDYAILVILSEAPDGARRSFQLGHELQWEASRLSHQLRRMEGRGLVKRRSCGEDGRGTTTTITAAGRRAIEAAAPLHVAEVRRVFVDVLDEAQLDTLIACADRVASAVDGSPGDPCPEEDGE